MISVLYRKRASRCTEMLFIKLSIMTRILRTVPCNNQPSESTKPAVLKSFSSPLPNNMHLQQEEKSLGKDAFHKKTVESQPSGYEWWKEVEVELPTYFLKRRKERLLAEKVGWSRGNGQNKE